MSTSSHDVHDVHDRPPTDAELLLPTGWPDVTDVEAPDRRVLVAIAVAALGTDLAVRSGLGGLAGALLLVAVALGPIVCGRVPNRRAWPILLTAAVLGSFLALRSAEWLVGLDLLAAAATLVLGASLARSGDPLHQSIPDLLGRGLHAVAHGFMGLGFVGRALRRADHAGAAADSTPGSSTAALVRGVLLAAPVVLVVGLLLGSADPVFASFFHFPTDAGDLVLHAVLLTFGAWGAAGLLRLASAAPYDLRPQGRRILGTVEATTVLAGLVTVFAAFAVSQLVTVLGGADYVRRTAGLSYAEYARNGFFQLLAVAAITLGVLLALRASVRVADRRFLVLSEAAVVLTLLLVAGAVRRLSLYEQAYGLTLLRLWSVLFALWLGGVFVLLGLSLAGVRRSHAWFVPAAVALGLATLLVVDVANPEAIIVRRNVARLAASDHLDPAHLAGLSDDAVPALADALPSLRPSDAAVVVGRICAGERRAEGGFWAFNASRDAAIEARNRVCPRLSA